MSTETFAWPGLDDAEASRRLEREGPNALPRRRPSLARRFLQALREPMVLLLVVAGGLYLVLGDRIEALTLLASVSFVVTIGLVQSYRTERALEALRALTSARAIVIREGRRARIPVEQVVVGDLVMLVEGDRVPADAKLVHVASLSVDESLLTGESVPVRKRVAAPTDGIVAPGGDDLPLVFSGTLVVEGTGVAEVFATGPRSELGRIGDALGAAAPSRSGVEHEVDQLVRRVAIVAVVASVVLALVSAYRAHDVVDGLLTGVAFAMSLLPEELPIVLTAFFALGALRLSRVRVLSRRPSAIEALGAATVLCTDKTGTLTENRMRIARLWAEGVACTVGTEPLPEVVHAVVEHGVLASRSAPFDPMEVAFHALADETLAGTEHLHADYRLVRAYPLSPALLSMAHVWRGPKGDVLVVSAKGAPEAIVDLCHLDAGRAAAIRAAVEAMACDGLRVLAVAHATLDTPELPESQHDFAFRIVGLVGLEDPLRHGVREAIGECTKAGVRVVMITGDYPHTAIAIARAAGIARPGNVATGAELAALDDAALVRRLGEVYVIARAVPDHKLRIVRALLAAGEVVAMTGDGVNDAPALEAAQIGIAMGGRGTEVAREASDLVVTDDRFSSIVEGIALGRRIYDNLEKAVVYVLSVHVPIIGLAFLPTILGLPTVLYPLHIVFLELLIDPACSLAFEVEPAEADVMTRPPRRADARLVNGRVLAYALSQGASVLVAALACLFVSRALGLGEGVGRALAFAALVGGNVALIHANRRFSARGASIGGNSVAWVVTAVACVALAVVLFVPPVAGALRFEPVSVANAALALAIGLASMSWVPVAKRLRVPIASSCPTTR